MRFLPALAALVLLGAGCSALDDDPAGDGEVRVAAATYPLAWVAERLSEGTGTKVDLLTRPGGEAHDLELGVQETALVADADLVVLQGGFQPAVEETVAQNATGRVLDAADVVDLVAIDESHEEHAAHDGHGDEHAEESHDHHGHGDTDPHFWLDPIRMVALGEEVADLLAAVDPEHAERYRENLETLRTDLVDLDETWTAGLERCARDTIVVSHDAFGYLEKYGLEVASIVGLSPDAEPTGAALGELQQLIRREGITTVFSEPLKPALGKNLARDLGLTEGVLDPIEGLSKDSSDEDYLSLMEANLEAIRAANGCR
ncbi:zinc ABC transporter substrate-binding protein [Nocardioides sp. zg-536]|uniref:Zinc ABC transporter substrate-binding protein n=1 Tax=Nocardioides faecalis TaxID=2803858 RepID=A0A938Y6T9_9ACTN|nr:metal ABC transporter substrate-binding protein [Nocardioides faecalis]MBM9460282.1 zinc ABC transporter substrate-binding protein [Nocardioides faecalis]QVI59878.1 zinc ABC transporter substrate-binding protein [Nocardioides faecalis]